MEPITIGFVTVWLICGFASMVIAESKGREGCSWALAGILLGPIGVLMAIGVTSQKDKVEALPGKDSNLRKCPTCAELVQREAIKCRFCGEKLEPMAAPVATPVAEPAETSKDRFNCAGCGYAFNKRIGVDLRGKTYCPKCAATMSAT